jgi:hypothetical protein
MTFHIFTLLYTAEFVVHCDMYSLISCYICLVTEDMYLQPPQIWAREGSAPPHQKKVLLRPNTRADSTASSIPLPTGLCSLAAAAGTRGFSAAYLRFVVGRQAVWWDPLPWAFVPEGVEVSVLWFSWSASDEEDILAALGYCVGSCIRCSVR